MFFFKKGPQVKVAIPKNKPNKIGKSKIVKGIKFLKFSSKFNEFEIQKVPDKKKPIPKM